MRRHVHRVALAAVGSMLAVSFPAAATAAGNDGPPPSKNLLTLGLLGKLIPIPMPITQLPLPLLDGDVLDLEIPDVPDPAEYPDYGGRAIGAYAEAHVGDLLTLQTATLGAEYVGLVSDPNHDTLFVHSPLVPPYVGVKGITVAADGYANPWAGTRRATADTRVAWAKIMGVDADGITASVKVLKSTTTDYSIETEVKFGELRITDQPVASPDIPPNTVYQVPGLGTVVLNEQTITRLPGDRYGALVHAIHITLDSALGDLPVGADIYIGTAEAFMTD